MLSTKLIDAIRPGEILTLPDFLTRTGQKKAAWRSARRNAIKLGIQLDYRSGRQCFVATDGWIELLKRLPELKGAR